MLEFDKSGNYAGGEHRQFNVAPPPFLARMVRIGASAFETSNPGFLRDRVVRPAVIEALGLPEDASDLDIEKATLKFERAQIEDRLHEIE